MKNSNHLTYIDLFSGAGGVGLGFDRAGYRCVGVVENDLQAGNTYSKNFLPPSTSLFRLGPEQGNIESLNKALLKDGLRENGVHDLDVLLGGPPCQGFSQAGRLLLSAAFGSSGHRVYAKR